VKALRSSIARTRTSSRPAAREVIELFLLGDQAVLLALHAAVGAEGAVWTVEILAVRGVAHQVSPEPRRRHGKRDALGALVHPPPMVRGQLVDEEGRLGREREEE